MIGKVCYFSAQFYDVKTGTKSFKTRPFLVVGKADSGDYSVLPVSKVSDAKYIHPIYDVPIDPASYPLLNLNPAYISYIRTHKQTVVNHADYSKAIGDMKADYQELFLLVMVKLEEYSKNLISEAL
jgi:hypothetical protein